MADEISSSETRVEWDGFHRVERSVRRPSKTEVLKRSAMCVGTLTATWLFFRLVIGQEIASSESLWGGLIGVIIANAIWAFRGWVLIEG
ncbi:hypothetical protein GCM10022280_14090 [Sphingomonas swuensis]|uniref:Uncharacterized protein n=1 Tax=Sphingomonas swuensis TaxID=977800 RepID=A0ABP7STA4_9SPHN